MKSSARLIITVAVLILAPWGFPVLGWAEESVEEPAGDIAERIPKRSVALLLSYQREDGSWAQGAQPSSNYLNGTSVAVTAMAARALWEYREVEPKGIEEAVERTLEHLLEKVCRAEQGVEGFGYPAWGQFYTLELLTRLIDDPVWEGDRDRLRREREEILRKCYVQQGMDRCKGAWGCPGYYTSFQTAGAILTLDALKASDVPVEEAVLSDSIEALRRMREGETVVFGYTRSHGASPAAAVGRLGVCALAALRGGLFSRKDLQEALGHFMEHRALLDMARRAESYHHPGFQMPEKGIPYIDFLFVYHFAYYYSSLALLEVDDPTLRTEWAKTMREDLLKAANEDGTWTALRMKSFRANVESDNRPWATACALLALKHIERALSSSPGKCDDAVPPEEEIVRAVRELGSEDFERREEACRELLAWGTLSPDRVLAAFPEEHPDPEVLERCDRLRREIHYASVRRGALGRSGDDDKLRSLVEALFSDPSPETLGRFAKEVPWPPEVRSEVAALFLDSEEGKVCAAALDVLGNLGVERYAGRVEPFLKHPRPEVVAAAARAMGNLGDADQARKVVVLLEENHFHVGRAVIEAVKRFHERGIDTALHEAARFLDHPEEEVRWMAAQAMAKVGGFSALGPFEETVERARKFWREREGGNAEAIERRLAYLDEQWERHEAGEEWYVEHGKRWHRFTEACPAACAVCRERIQALLEVLSEGAHMDAGALRSRADRQLQATIEPWLWEAWYRQWMDHLVQPVVVKSLCGLAFVSQGSGRAEGAYREEVQACYDFVKGGLLEVRGGYTPVRGIPHPGAQWALVFGTLFLAELHRREPCGELKALLEEAGERFIRLQLPEGGWEQRNAPGVVYEIVAFTNLVVVALHELAACGIEVPDQVYTKVLGYYRACANEDGGMIYGLHKKRLRREKEHPTVFRSEAGRTGGAVLALELLGRTDEEVYQGALAYFDGHLKRLVEGHGSLHLHRLLCGWACHRLGGDFWDRYRYEVLARPEYPEVNSHNDYFVPYFSEAVDAILLQAPLERLPLLGR
jgi:HEAT repeat protein